MKKFTLLVSVIAIIGCSAEQKKSIPVQIQKLENLIVYPEDPKLTKSISFQKDTVFGGSEDLLMGGVGSITVDNSGRVFIADIRKLVINVFEKDGSFITELGREGRGPNEFESIRSLHLTKNRLYAYDSKQNRVNIFNLDNLDAEKTLVLAQNRIQFSDLKRAFPSIDDLYVKNDNTYIAMFRTDGSMKNKIWQNFDMRGSFYPLDISGQISKEKLFEKKIATGTEIGFPPSPTLLGFHIKPFFGNSVMVLSSNNSIYWADPENFLIKVYTPNGGYDHSFYYPNKKIPLTKESEIRAVVPDLYIKNMSSIDLPEHWPTITEMKIDDKDQLWIASVVEDMTVYEWWILKPTGELITKFVWPRSKLIQQIRNGYVYTKERSQNGPSVIVKYSFDLVEN